MKIKTVLVAASFLTAFSASAAQTETLTLSGKIFPGSCGITLGGTLGNGKIEYGERSKAAVLQLDSEFVGGFSVLKETERFMDLRIECSQPAELSIGVTDNRKKALDTTGLGSAYIFGVGSVFIRGVERYLGAYSINFSKLQVIENPGDAAKNPAGYLFATNLSGVGNWINATYNDAIYFGGDRSLGFKHSANDTKPARIFEVVGRLGVKASYYRSVIEEATTAIEINGMATFNVNYN